MPICTIFNAGLGYNKFPISPTDDNKFTFKNLNSSTNIEFFRFMVNNFILNIPLEKLKEPTISFRRKVDLLQYYNKNVEYFIINVDEVTSKNSFTKVIEFFKKYKIILGESSSYNGIDNFNMKGVMFTNNVLLSEFKYAIYALNESLKKYCIINTAPSRMSTYSTPIGKEKIVINNENGELYTFDRTIAKSQVNIIKESYEYSKLFTAENSETSKSKTTLNREFIELIKNDITDFDTIEELSLSVFASMGFEYVECNEYNALVFKHFSEINSKGGYFWFKDAPYTMNHLNILKTVNIFDVIKKIPQSRELLNLELDYNILLSSENNHNKNIITKNSRYLEVDEDIKNGVQSFLYKKDCNLLKIKSPMGTGKSTVIDYIIKESHFDDLSVLIVTNRISVADDFNKKYNMKIYNKDHYHINDSLICQYDSLWKYDIKYFDVVIMDEFISVLLHSRSSLNKSAMNTNKFLKSFNKKVVVADAFLTGYEDYFFESKNSDKTVTIDNQYRDETQLYSYENSNAFVKKLVETARVEPITVSSTSTSFIKSLELLLYNNNIKVATLTSETTQFSKEVIYGSFRSSVNNLFDVLIYSPTLTVGVSNMNNVDKHFHYDSSKSTDVISSLQMIKRTRKTSEIHYHIKGCKKYLPTSYSVLRDEYISKIGKNIEQNHLFEYDDYGNPNISKLGKMSILIDVYRNIIEYSHLSAFEHLLKMHFKNPVNVIKSTFQENPLTRYKKMLKNNVKNNDEMALQQYLNLNKLNQLRLNVGEVSKSLKNIIEIRENVDIDIDDDVLEKVINLQLKDPKFTEKCYYWKLVKSLHGSDMDTTFIKRLTSKAIRDNNVLKINNLNNVIKYSEFIKKEYKSIVLVNDKSLKSFIKLCGFKDLTYNVGHRDMFIDTDVDKYCKHIVIN